MSILQFIQLLITAGLGAFIGSVLQPVVTHLLEKSSSVKKEKTRLYDELLSKIDTLSIVNYEVIKYEKHAGEVIPLYDNLTQLEFQIERISSQAVVDAAKLAIKSFCDADQAVRRLSAAAVEGNPKEFTKKDFDILAAHYNSIKELKVAILKE